MCKEKDVFGWALRDFYMGSVEGNVLLHNSYGSSEAMPVELFFREEQDLPDIESYALSLCKGSILDIGAGVGSHALMLQEQGLTVSALEISTMACEIMKTRGVDTIINEDIFNFHPKRFDTLLLLMNGIGLVGDLERLGIFLELMKKLLLPGGQVLLDSSNIAYLYEGALLPKNRYFGEIEYQYEYKKVKGDWFKWLYIDQEMLFETALVHGWNVQIIFEDQNDQYLARLVLA